MSKIINVGRVTSYADAVAGGYTGTREQWEHDLANLGTVAAEVEADRAEVAENTATVAKDKAAVEEDKNAAESAAGSAAESAASAHTDAIAATAAKEAAQTAQGLAENAASTAANAKDAAQTAQGKAEDAQTAAEAARTAAEDAQTAAAGSASAAAESATAAAESEATAQHIADMYPTDKTLSVVDKAADGKATGDAFADLKSTLESVEDYTKELPGIKSGSYDNNLVPFLQGTIDPSDGSFSPGNTKRASTDFIYIPDDASVSVTLKTGYTKSNLQWYSANKSHLQNGGTQPSSAKYVRFVVMKSDNTQTITTAEAQTNTTVTITQPASVMDNYNKIGITALPTTAQTLTGAVAEHETDINGINDILTGEVDSTAELVGLKSGTYVNKLVRFLQGGINPNTGEFTPGRTDRTTSDFLYIPTGATVSFSVETGYTKTNAIWFDASKTFLQNGNPMPLNARFVRIGVEKSDNTQNISPSEARSNTTYTVEQPVSVEGLSNNVADVDNRLKPIESWYDVYDEYIVEKENITSKVTNGAFGAGFNDASYSNGTLTIPANSSGVSSYIGVRITSGFSLLKNNVARVKIAFDDLSGIELEQKILKSPNTDWVHVIDFNIDLQTNVVEVTFLIDSDSATYVFFGVQVSATATAQTSQKTITYNGATIYSSESYDIPVKRPLKIQLFGDSITDDVRVVSGSETIITTWASKIAEYMTGYDLTIVNSAVGGSGIGHGKSSTARYSTKTYNYVHDLVTDGTLVTSSDVIVILIGTNNWRGEGGGAFNTLGQLGDDNSGTTKTFYGYLDQICKYISDNSEALVIWATPPQRYNSADQDSPTNSLGEALNSESHTLKEFCTAIKEVANLYGMPVIDLNSNLGWNKYNVADFTSDGLHPSATKCYRITEVICGALKAYIGD